MWGDWNPYRENRPCYWAIRFCFRSINDNLVNLQVYCQPHLLPPRKSSILCAKSAWERNSRHEVFCAIWCFWRGCRCYSGTLNEIFVYNCAIAKIIAINKLGGKTQSFWVAKLKELGLTKTSWWPNRVTSFTNNPGKEDQTCFNFRVSNLTWKGTPIYQSALCSQNNPRYAV